MSSTLETLEQQEKKALEKLQAIKARKQAIVNREKAKQKEQERKDDTRRKILLGSYLLKKMENEANKEKILAELNEYLTEDRDRILFNLALLND
jgi:hypothetical protein